MAAIEFERISNRIVESEGAFHPAKEALFRRAKAIISGLKCPKSIQLGGSTSLLIYLPQGDESAKPIHPGADGFPAGHCR